MCVYLLCARCHACLYMSMFVRCVLVLACVRACGRASVRALVRLRGGDSKK
jgi:hypothetical protein